MNLRVFASFPDHHLKQSKAKMSKKQEINTPETDSGDEAPTIHLHIDELDMSRMSANGSVHHA